MSDTLRGVYIDLETGGLDPATSAVLEIAVLPFEIDASGAVTINDNDALCQRIIPEDELTLCPRALAVNGRRWESLTDGISEYTAYWHAVDVIRGHIRENESGYDWTGRIWAHNAPFDAAFMAHLETRAGVRGSNKRFSHRCDWGCTKSLAQMLMGTGRLQPCGTSLHYLANALGVAREGEAHTALSDARLGIHVLAKLLPIAGWIPQDGAK